MMSDFNSAVLQQFDSDEKGLSVVPVSRAALGLIAVLRSWKREIDECVVAMPAAVCHDLVAAVLEAGGRPFFCDVNPANGLVPESEWVRARQAGASVALVVHLYGNAADVAAVRRVFPAPGCLLIDDAAQALGTRYNESQVGLKGDIGLVSFGASKHINAGGAAILSGNDELLTRVQSEIEEMKYSDPSLIVEAEKKFRQGFEYARKKLRENDDNSAFASLLDGYQAALYPPFPEVMIADLVQALKNYPHAARERQSKARLWRKLLQGSGLLPVGMEQNTIPWRFTCRLPGINWRQQYALGEAMREKGLHVSHWYLPANWLLAETIILSMPGTETLAREVFQFWIDEQTSLEDIEKGAVIVTELVEGIEGERQCISR